MLYVPSVGGANTTTRLLMRGLAQNKHECRMVVTTSGGHGPATRGEFLEALAVRGLSLISSSARADVFRDGGVEIHAVHDLSQLRAYVIEQIRKFAPTWTIVPSLDPGQVLLEAAVEESEGRVVYLALNPWELPFGPCSASATAIGMKLMRRTAGIITISEYFRDYIRQWGGFDSCVMHFPVYGSEPFPLLGSFDNEFVTMINPSANKGIAIFLKLAEKFPAVKFAGVPTWATTAMDQTALERLANVTLLDPVENIDEIFARTRVLLVPSICSEAFGNIVGEAMLRGIPVLASDNGGLREAKLGVDYVLPVRASPGFTDDFDDRNCPIPIVPEQDTGPWEDALGEVLKDRSLYERLSTQSREAAREFVARIEKTPWDQFLLTLTSQSRLPERAVDSPAAKNNLEPGSLLKLDELTPEKRALLVLGVLRLKGKATD
jgi:glycosyltransferase involved in cell wall biosynthesis